MQKYSDVVLSPAGTPVAGAVITVTTYPDGAAATIYAADGGPSVASVATNVNGRFSFYAPNGHYSILVTGTGITPVTYNDVVLFDQNDGFVQAGSGAVARAFLSKSRERFSVFDFGAKGDATDDTAYIQAAINALPAGGILTGLGATFTVSSLQLKSNMAMENINLVTKAGAVDMVSPITIDGRTTAKTNIRLENVTVDGNRINQTNVGSPGSEDGGRHGFRLVGACSNIAILRCKANYCAGDGLEMFSSTSVGTDDSTFVFNNIVIRDFQANYNRRHGLSGDSINGLRLDNVETKWNGLDLNTTDPLTSGGRGSRNGSSQLYGNGLDLEGYGLGSCINDVRMNMVTALQNARGGALFYDALSTRPAGFSARQKIWITDCYFDEGQDSTRTGEALTFTSTIGSKTLAYLYDSIYIKNTRLDGYLLARNVNNLQFDGEIRTSTAANYALLDHSDKVVLSVVPTGTTKTIYSDTSTYSLDKESVPTPANPVLAYSSGVTGTLASIVYTALENKRDRVTRFLITANWTASASGVPVFTISPPAGGQIVAPPRIEVISSATAQGILAFFSLSIGSFRFNDPGTAQLQFQITVDVKV